MSLDTEERRASAPGPAAAAGQGLSRNMAVAVAALTGLVLVQYLVARGSLETLTAEDGLVEYLTSALYLIAAVGFAALAVRMRSRIVWYAGLAVVFLFIGGEEISWGQRLFDIDTPASLKEANVQDELTLHNIDGLHGNVRMLGLLAFVSLYLALPAVVRYSPRAAAIVRRVSLPVPSPLASLLAVVAIAFMVLTRLAGSVVFSLDEIGELYFAIAAQVFFWSQAALRRRYSGAAVQAPSG